MLVLTLKVDEAVEIDGNIIVIALRKKSGRLVLGFEAPREKQIRRIGQVLFPADAYPSMVGS